MISEAVLTKILLESGWDRYEPRHFHFRGNQRFKAVFQEAFDKDAITFFYKGDFIFNGFLKDLNYDRQTGFLGTIATIYQPKWSDIWTKDPDDPYPGEKVVVAISQGRIGKASVLASSKVDASTQDLMRAGKEPLKKITSKDLRESRAKRIIKNYES